jgi:hypothetical protein
MATKEKVRRRDKTNDADKRLANLEASIRICQLMVQQVGKAIGSINEDVSKLTDKQRSVQYRLLAVQNFISNTFPEADLLSDSEALQIKDFEEYSSKDDTERNLLPSEEVAEDSVVTITTVAENGQSISRSKFDYSKLLIEELKQPLLGKKVGDSFSAQFNGTTHQVTVLQVKKLPETPVQEATQNV